MDGLCGCTDPACLHCIIVSSLDPDFREKEKKQNKTTFKFMLGLYEISSIALANVGKARVVFGVDVISFPLDL